MSGIGPGDPGATGGRGRRASFPVARIAGIEIRVHLTFLLLLALFAWAGPAAGMGTAWQAVAWVILVFVCVLGHELAHSLVARRRGGDVHEILLFPLGGVSKLEHLPERPADELAIALAGPLASVAMALGAGLLALATRRPLLPVDLVTGAWLTRLAWLNLLLAAFNLIPAFPLDGGRVYRALLERTMDLESATRRATRVGHGFAIALMILGFLLNPWLLFIGVFVYFGASAEEAATIVHVRLRGHRVREVMRTDVDRLTPAVTIDGATSAPDDLLTDELVVTVANAPHRQIAVVAHGSIVGALRLEDIDRLVREPRHARRTSEAS